MHGDNVPERDLVSTRQIPLRTDRLKIASALSEAAPLVQELLASQVNIPPQAHDTRVALREGSHDDLVQFVANPGGGTRALHRKANGSQSPARLG